MSFREVMLWSRYRNKNGSLGLVRKYDRPAALVASIMANVHGNKTKLSDFLPYGVEEAVDQAPTIEEIKAKLGRSLKIGKRR
jgi:hypothetical protein